MSDIKKSFKMPSSLPALVGVLIFIATLSGLLLAITYEATKDTIVTVELQKTKTAFETVLPGFDNDPLAEKITTSKGLTIYPLTKSGTLLGYAIETFSDKGYSGFIGVMVGLDATGTLKGIKILKAAETPGLGSNISSPSFQSQFIGLQVGNPLMVKKDGGEIDAIAAATISSRAVCEAINLAFDAIKEITHE